MDLTAFARYTTENFSLFLLLLPLIFLLILKQIKSQNLPPGPRPWPIIGNIHHMMGFKPHISMTHFAQVHGPLISLRLGTQLLVVASSPEAATEILKTHDRLLCARQKSNSFIPEYNRFSIVSALECNDQWKSLRALCRNELFSAKAIESQSTLRERKMGEMLEFLGTQEGKVVNIGEVVFGTILNTLGNVCFSKDFVNLKDDQGVTSGLKGLIRNMMELGSTPNIADFYPVFARFDLQGIRKKNFEYTDAVFELWKIIIKERRENKGLDADRRQDLLDDMLSNGFSDLGINILALELFAAGTDTTTSTIEWAVAELLKKKEAMHKVREEIRREITADHSIKESHLSQLQYLNACVKETLRLHPPAPFLVPHRALETCEVMSYKVPKNSGLLVNVWAIGRDPKVWEDPLSFKPERFLDSSLDFRGQDFEFIPFGAGRRMCPGLPLATKKIHLILASLIHGFEWFLPNDEDPSQLDMNEKFGVTLQKEQPLLLIPKSR